MLSWAFSPLVIITPYKRNALQNYKQNPEWKVKSTQHINKKELLFSNHSRMQILGSSIDNDVFS